MKLTITRSGGILGVPTSYQLDTDRLPEALANHVSALVESAPHGAPSARSGADTFQYDIAEEGSTLRRWTFHGEDNSGSALFKIAQSAGSQPT